MHTHQLSTSHRCLGCGGSCQGISVALAGEERERIAALGNSYGLDAVTREGRLALTASGACVFLDGGKCRLHRDHGPQAKPKACQAYPLVVLQTERERRIGLDPGCYTAMRTVDSAQPLQVGPEIPVCVSSLADEQRMQEDATLSLLRRPGGRASAVLAALIQTELRGGFAQRWLGQLRRPEVKKALYSPSLGASVRDKLGPVFDELALFAVGPDKPLPEPLDRWTLDVAERMVFLRLAPMLPNPFLTATLTLAGGVALGWVHDKHAPFGEALAAWVRALRDPIFWGALFPDPRTYTFVMRGRA